MATTNDPNSPPAIRVGSLSDHTVPTTIPTPPYPPSPVEAKFFYYGIPSQPRLVARSSTDAWVVPTGPEAYLRPKEFRPIGVKHPLREIWEATVGPAIVAYLDSKGVKWTSLDPIRMGYASESSSSSPPHPAILWMGVVPGSLSPQDGVEVATVCKGILSAHGIDDVHVEIRESQVTRSAVPGSGSGAKLYKPAYTSNATAQAREPFSTALGLPICAEGTPSIEGTAGFFLSDPRNPGKLYLVTARHVVFPPDGPDGPDGDSNELYQHHRDSTQRRRNALLCGDAAIERHITAIGSEIADKYTIIEQLERRLKDAEELDEEDGEAERNHVLPQLERANKAIEVLETFLEEVSRDWTKRENRILGHVVLSPPIGFGVGEEGFTEDWAVIEMDDSKIDVTNFVGNVIDLGTTIPVDVFTNWMVPPNHYPANPPSFTYPGNRLLKFCGTIPEDEVWKPSPKALHHNHDGDHDGDPCIIVMKRGYASDLTVGHLNTLRSFTRVILNDQLELGQMSKELAVLPRNSTSGAFSSPGDSGAAVVDGKGRVAGLLTGGAGAAEESDCTYLTSINFLLNRMAQHGLEANLSPSLDP